MNMVVVAGFRATTPNESRGLETIRSQRLSKAQLHEEQGNAKDNSRGSYGNQFCRKENIPTGELYEQSQKMPSPLGLRKLI